MPKEPRRRRRARGESSAARTRRGSLRTEGTAQSFPSAAATAGPGRTEPSRVGRSAPQVSGSGAVRPRTDIRTDIPTRRPHLPPSRCPRTATFAESCTEGSVAPACGTPEPGEQSPELQPASGGTRHRCTEAAATSPPGSPIPSCPRPLLHLLSSSPRPRSKQLLSLHLAGSPGASPLPPAAGAPARLLRLSPRWLRTQLPRRRCPVRSGLLAWAGSIASQRGASPAPARGPAEPAAGGRSPQQSPALPSGDGGARGCGGISDGGETWWGSGALSLPSPLPCSSRGAPRGGTSLQGTAGPPS